MELSNNEYYVTVDDVINNSEFTEDDLQQAYGDKIEFYLKDLSSKTYSIMYGAYRGIHRERQRTALQYIINNDESKQNAILKAIIEYIRGDISIGLSLNLYTDGKSYSEEVVNILKRNGLWIVATIEYNDEDIA